MGLRQEAKTLLQQALQTLRASIGFPVDEADIDTCFTRQSDVSGTVTSSSQRQASNDQATAHITGTDMPQEHAFTGWSGRLLSSDENDDEGVFVYSRALCLHPIFLDEHFELYAAAILFNLGLVHHIMALEQHRHNGSGVGITLSHQHYQESCMFYEFAMKNLQCLEQQQHEGENIPALSRSNNIKEWDVLKAMLLNNSGHVFYTNSMDLNAAFHCFTASSTLVIHYSNSRNSVDCTYPARTLDDTDFDSLLHNILLFMPSVSAAASA